MHSSVPGLSSSRYRPRHRLFRRRFVHVSHHIHHRDTSKRLACSLNLLISLSPASWTSCTYPNDPTSQRSYFVRPPSLDRTDNLSTFALCASYPSASDLGDIRRFRRSAWHLSNDLIHEKKQFTSCLLRIWTTHKHLTDTRLSRSLALRSTRPLRKSMDHGSVGQDRPPC